MIGADEVAARRTAFRLLMVAAGVLELEGAVRLVTPVWLRRRVRPQRVGSGARPAATPVVPTEPPAPSRGAR